MKRTFLVVFLAIWTNKVMRVFSQNIVSECFGEDEFLVVEEDLDFNDAKDVCVELGGTLARISDQAEFNFVISLLEKLDNDDNVWMGISR